MAPSAVGRNPRRASRRCAGVAPFALQLLLERPARGHAALGASESRATRTSACRPTASRCPASRSAWRRTASTPRAERAGSPRGRARSCRRLGHARGGARDGNAGRPSRKASSSWLALERHWAPMNNFVHHFWWHRAMFHLQRREHDAGARALRPALSRPRLAAACEDAGPLHRHPERRLDAVPPRAARRATSASRWDEIADKAEARIGDCLSDLHPAALGDGARRGRA